MRNSKAMSRPPEGAFKGESVPVGSEPDEYDREEIEKISHVLKSRGEPYISMSESELREKALELWNDKGGS